MEFPIDEILIDPEAEAYDLTHAIARATPQARVRHGKEAEKRFQEISIEPNPLRTGKRTLKLVERKGSFIKDCPGTKGYICCGLKILHFGQGCPIDCAYCALQVYLNRPVIELFVNQDSMISELKDHITERPDQFHRFCTGEFADSLALEPLTGVAARLASLFNGFENASIEFKTKSDNVRELLGLNPKGNQVVSFSVNAASIAFGQELGAASLERRIKAARMAQESGYKIGFHFDPIIPIGDWKQEYLKTINMIYDNIDCERIAWISLGVMRFAPKLKETARSRFGQIPLFHLSYHSGIDGKKRLFVNRRIEIYRWIIDGIKGRDSNARIYFCMESSYVWKEALGVSMESDEDLIRFLGMAFP